MFQGEDKKTHTHTQFVVQTPRMACFERASPALKEFLLKLHRAEKPTEIDHHLYEFGSVEYHIQSTASDPHHIYLSISTPLLSQGVLLSYGLPHSTLQTLNGVYSDVVEVVEPARGGYQLTLRLNFDKLPNGKGSIKVITDISSVQAVILSSQLKEMLRNLGSSQGMHKPIKLVYHPREPFFVVKLPEKITAVFPMRFRDNSDVIIATAFFQELMDVGCSEAWTKAPPCTWSPIPPPELRGELFQDLSTNGGFVSFDISSRHVEGAKLDKTVMQKESTEGDEHAKIEGCSKCMKKLLSFSKPKILRRKCGNFTKKIMKIRSPIKIHGFDRFRRRWLKIPKFYSAKRYTKLD
ncbi:hypothetical protein HHK36_012918 [Tetracentron sinense]|uniref:Arp2/3 complex 34 kDa subunit n=1 Tax=Tetracentron sinense TaxID=13715 RepID=A0A834Z921_TETSI|nr:hypothetical protein HHK36_012918 [Tetracentron sinense]